MSKYHYKNQLEDPDSNHFISDCFKPRDEWVPDELAKECRACQNKFDLFTRRHHCRMCGNVFDHKCSNQFIGPPIFTYMNESKIRLCRPCFDKSMILAKKAQGQSLKGKIGLKRLSSDQIGILDFNVRQGLKEIYLRSLSESLMFLLEENTLDKKWYNLLRNHVEDVLEHVSPCNLSGDDIDINQYIKIKKILFRDTSLTNFIRGEVLRKNVAHKKMPREIGQPVILMIKGSIELTKPNEISFMDSVSLHKEQEHLEANVLRILGKLMPKIVITEGSVHRNVQELLQNKGVSLIMKLKTKQFDRIANLTGSKPFEEFDKIDVLGQKKLGNCVKFTVLNHENKPYYEKCERFKNNKLLWDNFDPSLMTFEGCKKERGGTILISGPDENELINVKSVLKKLFKMLRNNMIENAIIYDDLQVYHSRERLFDKVSEITNISDPSSDFRDTLSIESYLAEDLENVDQGEHATCLLNPTTASSVGFLNLFLTERYSLKDAFDKTKIVFTKTVSVPVDFTLHEFNNLNNSQRQNVRDRLNRSKRFHKKELCQIGSDPKRMAIKFYSNEDITLGYYLRYKWSRVLDICPETRRFHFYNTTFFFYDRFYVKISLDLKEGPRLKHLKMEIKKETNAAKDDDQPDAISAQDEVFFYDFQTVLHSPEKGIRTSLSQFPKDNVLMYIECSKCCSKLSESIKITTPYMDYSFSRYLQTLAISAAKYLDLLNNPSKTEGFISKCIGTIEKLEMLPNIKDCCPLASKTRVFNIDDLNVKFNIGKVDIYKIDHIDYSNQKSVASIKAANEKIINLKKGRLGEIERGYLSLLINSMKELLEQLIEKSKLNVSIETLDKIESILNVNNPLSKDPYNRLLLGIVPIYKDIINLKYVSEKTLTVEPENHLEIDLWRKKFVERLNDLFDIFDTRRAEFEILLQDVTKTPMLASGLVKSTSRPNEGFELGEMKNNHSTLDRMKSSVYFDENYVEEVIENDKEKEKKDYSDENEKENALLESLNMGFNKTFEPGDPEPNQKFKVIPLIEDQPLSILAFTLNSGMYMRDIYNPEGFIEVERMIASKPKEEKFGDEVLKIMEKKLIVTEKTQKQFIMKLPNSDYKPKCFNNMITTIQDENGDPVIKSRRKKTGNLDMIHDIAGIIDLGHVGNRSMSMSMSMASSQRGMFESQKSISSKYAVIIHYPVQFEALRTCYNFDLSTFISTISTSNQWKDVAGGKTKAKFEKTNDERLVFKDLEKKNFGYLLGFMPEYFKYVFDIMNKKKSSVLAKIFGIFEIQTEKKIEYKIVMENLFFGFSNEAQVYDLKGSVANRFANPAEQKVLLDTNYRTDRNGEPLPLESTNYDYLENSLKNDAEFLARVKVMDYSLLLLIDDATNMIRVGIIDITEEFDYKRFFEKHYKKFIKKVDPTVAQPGAYKERFLAAMKKFFMPIYRESHKPKY